MYLKHVMIDGCKWLLVVARGCIYTLGTRSAQSPFILHMHECLYLFMDDFECVIMWMLHMDRCLCTHVVLL